MNIDNPYLHCVFIKNGNNIYVITEFSIFCYIIITLLKPMINSIIIQTSNEIKIIGYYVM